VATQDAGSGVEPVQDATTAPDSMRVLWRRLAVIATVGVVTCGSALAYLALRPAHADVSRAGRNTPLAVSCPSAGFCMVVDDQGNVVERHDGAWSGPRSLQDTGLTSVSCSSPSFCVATGVNGTASVFRGSTWSAARTIDPKSAGQIDGYGTSSLNTVSCPTTTFCMAGDVLGRVSTFNGTRWTRPRAIESRLLSKADRQSATAGITSVSCPRPAFCAAVTVQGRALTYDGTTWSRPTELEPASVVNLDRVRSLPALVSVSCAAVTFCATVDPAGSVFTYDGTSWSGPVEVVPPGQRDANGLTSISCPTAGSCVAVDDSGHAFTSNGASGTSGTSWSGPVEVDPILGLATVSCATPTFCVALNDLGLASVSDGHSWTTPVDIDP
jgi:hypothetical protein